MAQRKGAELSINTIVLVVIVLLVAALLIFLVGKKLGLFGAGTGCVGQGGRCDTECEPGEQPLGLECPQDTPVCCKKAESYFPQEE